MKLEDETLLTAYLDDELDPPRKLAVEAALLSRPQLAERLQELSAVRSLVDGMARPTAPFDLSSAIMAEVASGPWAWIRLRRRTVAQLKQPRVLAAAALLMLAATVGIALKKLQTADRPAAPVEIAAESRPKQTSPVPSPRPTVSSDSSFVVANSVSVPRAGAKPTEVVPTLTAAAPAALSEADRKLVRDHEVIRSLLDRTDVRRMTLELDTLDPETLARIESTIDRSRPYRSPRAKIRIGQGIVVDPAHPDEAVVYLVVIPEQSRDRFRRSLETQVPEAALSEDDDIANPSVLTQLADVGDLELIRGKAAAELSPNPPVDDPTIAHKHDGDTEPVVIEPGPPLPGQSAGGHRAPVDSTHPSVLEQRRRDADEAVRRRREQLAAAGTANSDDRVAARSVVYLVWVTTAWPS